MNLHRTRSRLAMTDNTESIIAFEVPDRRALVALLCSRICETLAADRALGRATVLLPWQASAPTIEELPGRVIAELLAEWEEAGGHVLVEVELSGFLETDTGPRAWGYLALHEGEPHPSRPEIDRVEVRPAGSGYRLEARIRTRGQGAGDA
jgi:hypothetical protein